jgi:DNA-binding MarR family transcriptional regulator
MERHVAQCHQQLGLTWLEAEALRALRELEDGPWAPKGIEKQELAERLGQTPPTVSKITTQIGSRGRRLIAETPDPADRRRDLLSLTEDGRRVADEYGEAVAILTRDLLARLRTDLVAALDRLERALPDAQVRRRRVPPPSGPIKKKRRSPGAR